MGINLFVERVQRCVQGSIVDRKFILIYVIDLPCDMMPSFCCFADIFKMLSLPCQKEICLLPQDFMLLEKYGARKIICC